MTYAAGRIGAGLQPARAARSIRPTGTDPRRRRRGCGCQCGRHPGEPCRGDRLGLRSGRPVAVHAGPRGAGDRPRHGTFGGARDARPAPRTTGRHQGPHRHRARSPRAGRRSGCRDPPRAMAAGRGRRRGGTDARRRRRDARQEHDRGLARPRAGRGGRRSVGLRRCPHARLDHRRSTGHRLAGATAMPSSSRPTSTPATSMRTGRRSSS